MTTQEFQELLASYEEEAQNAVRLRQSAAHLEIERSEFAAQEAARLVGEGMAKTPAEKASHDAPRYRQLSYDIANVTAEAGMAEARARALYLSLRYEIACREVLVTP